MPMKQPALNSVGIVGGGGWGTALAILLSSGRSQVRLWVRDSSKAERIRQDRINANYLPGVAVPATVQIVSEFVAAGSSDFLFWAVPSAALRDVAEHWQRSGAVRPETILVSCSKGIEIGSGCRMSEVLGAIFPNNPVAVLSGPNHAEEVARGVPAASVLGSDDKAVGERIQQLVSGRTLRVYTNPDIAGIELGGALKNVFALAAGISDGLGLGDNSKAALVTRSLAEMVRIGLALGGRRETFYGLSGVGDLVATCFSRHSRNRHVGARVGAGEALEQILASMQMVAEGVPTSRSIQALAAQRGLITPIVDEVFAILYQGQSAADGMRRLLNRELRPEED
jgi:glycerol-3-phosphate dehydrogenase (NAD(P)+)